MTFAGCNVRAFDKLRESNLNPTGQRFFFNASIRPGPVPRHWPTIAGGPARACVSIRPDLHALNKGHLDGELAHFLKQAPGGPVSLLGLWHEASHLNYPGVTGAALRTAQKHVQQLSHDIGANVKVGAIEIIDSLHPGEWMAPGLDFYAVDVYDNKQCEGKPHKMLDNFRARCEKINAAHGLGPAVICVAETNSKCPARRPFWFHNVWSWLQSNGYTSNTSCFLTYWREQGHLSGSWDPHDKAVVKTLHTIFEQSSP